MFEAKFTAQLGKTGLADVAIAAGDSEAQNDTISVNIDVGTMSKGQALILLDKIKDAIHAAPCPPLS